MAKGLFELVDTGEQESYPPEFICNYQSALLLSLLERGLLTHSQFERCMDKIQKQVM